MPEFYRLSGKPYGQKAQKATIRGTGDPFPCRDCLCAIPLPRPAAPVPLNGPLRLKLGRRQSTALQRNDG